MSRRSPLEIRILALDPTGRGFGYVVLETPRFLVHWGEAVLDRTRKNQAALERVSVLLDRYQPDYLVLEDTNVRACRRRARVRALLAAIRELAAERGVPVRLLSRARVRRTFAPTRARTLQQIATILAARFRELARWLPPKRKLWQKEDPRLRIFSALALAVTYLEYRINRRRSS